MSAEPAADAPAADAAVPAAPTPAPPKGSPGPPPSGAADATADAASSAPTRSSAHKSIDDAKEYAQGRETLRPPSDTTYVSGGRDQEVQVGNRIYYQAARSPVAEPGQVRNEQLVRLREQYVPVPGYDRMLADLRERRLLVLVGPPGSGRSTTALHLLDALTGGAVSRLEPETDLRTVDENLVGSNRGSLAEMTGPAAPPTQAQADRLAALLARQQSFCVVVATPTPAVLRAFADYRADCASPPFTKLLRGYLDVHLSADDPVGTADGLVELANRPDVREALGVSPRASEVAELATLLVAHAREELPVEAVRSGAAAFLDRRIARWFSDLGEPARREGTERGLRLAALRLALAVFDGLPHHIVVTAGAKLGDRLIQAGSPRLTPGRPVVADPDATLLAALDAELVDEDISYGGVSIPSQVIHYLDRRTPAVLLTHVWRRHHQLRPPMIEWLSDLSHHPQAAVRTRAAQATGLLAAADFSHTFPALIEPAAAACPSRKKRADPEHGEESDGFDAEEETWELRRGFAAMALDQAALDDTVRAVVDAILRRWRRSADHALRWTAARTLGYDIGLRSVAKSLDELRVIGTPWELMEIDDVPPQERAQVWDLCWVSGLGVARLFANGDRHEILTQLRRWLRHERKSVKELAQQTIVIMAELRMSAVGARTEGDGDFPTRAAGRDRWSILLGLTADDRSLLAPVADALRLVLNGGPAGVVVMDVIGSWWELGESDPAALDAFLDLVPYLVVDDRDRGRLTYAVDRRCRRWADPLSPEVAHRIRAAAIAAVQKART